MESIVIERREKWKSLKQRLGWKAMACCGAAWSPRPRISTISILDEDEVDYIEETALEGRQLQATMIGRSGNVIVINNRIIQRSTVADDQNSSASASLPLLAGHHHQHHHHYQHQHQHQQQVVVGSGMNLAMALAAERNSRGPITNVNVGPTPTDHQQQQQVKTLMRLIQETDGVDWEKQHQHQHQHQHPQRKEYNPTNNNNYNYNNNNVEGGGCDWMCCVCMERKKGAAFIPCGHAFCRVCSRQVRVSRASCPVCNRHILDILDLF